VPFVDLENDLTGLQKTADFLVVRKKLRQGGKASLVLGVISILVGAIHMAVNPIFGVINLPLAYVQILVGLWNRVAPSAEGILMDGVGFLTVGLCNLGFGILLLAFRGVPNVEAFILAIVQISWAGRRLIKDYPQFKEALRHQPPREDRDALDALIKKIATTKSEGPGAFAFADNKGNNWKAMLSQAAVILVNTRQHDVWVAGPEEVRLDVQDEVLLGKKQEFDLCIKDKKVSGTISPESLQKLQDWLGPQEVAAADEE
jgi:hypothetical protein